MAGNTFVAPLELKFASDGAGEFEGYGAIFGNVDSHGDMIAPRAFEASLAQHKAKGTMPAMYVQHGPAMGGDALPAGVWNAVDEDDRGLKVKGKISALDTDHGRRIRSLMQDGAMRGLSIGYRVATGGATFGQKAGEPRRMLKALNLVEVSIVRDPSNAEAMIHGIKAEVDPIRAAEAVASAMRLHDKLMANDGYGYGTTAQRAQLMNHLRDAYEALTGSRAPDGLEGWKADPTLREVEAMLREEFSLSRSQARAVAERRFKSTPRDEGSEAKSESATALRGVLDGFKLPSF